jgi:nucleoside 2-deoxyribosyltransferase
MSCLIYLACRFSRRHEMQGCRADLLRAGFTVTSRWIDLKEKVEADARQCADIDVADIKLADIIISFPDPARAYASRGGHFFEEGYAFASGKPVIIVGNRSHVFHHLCEFFPTWPQAFSALLRREQLQLAA